MQLFIGFDVGGTHIKHGVIDENGKELTTDEYDTPEDKNTFKKKWKAVVEAYQDEHDIVGIGVSFPGHINHHSGEAAKAGALDYLDGENLCELFAGLTDLPVTVENDANCAALGERWQGAGKDYEHFVCITIGTGIGGGIVMEGDLYRGSHYRAGEFGVLPVGNNGEPMHDVASASGLMKACRRALAVSEEEMPHGDAEGFAPYALSFRYGQRHAVELDAARQVGRALGAVEHRVVDIDLAAFGGSALTADIAVPKDRPAEAIGAGIPVTYVPARNTIFLSYALAWAEVIPAADIFLGVNALDYSGYPDCRGEYLAAFERMANLATRLGVDGTAIRIRAPLLELGKAQIIQRGLALGVDFGLTRTCYDPAPDGRACGHCDACLLRLRAFAEVGMRDPAPYR